MPLLARLGACLWKGEMNGGRREEGTDMGGWRVRGRIRCVSRPLRELHFGIAHR
jgi:hypothetical protein